MNLVRTEMLQSKEIVAGPLLPCNSKNLSLGQKVDYRPTKSDQGKTGYSCLLEGIVLVRLQAVRHSGRQALLDPSSTGSLARLASTGSSVGSLARVAWLASAGSHRPPVTRASRRLHPLPLRI